MPQKYTSIDQASDLKSEALLFLAEMDQDYFPTPWSREAWDKLFQSIGQKYLLIIAEGDQAIMGFALLDVSVADSFAHLLKIVVSPNFRGLGVGRKILSSSLKDLSSRGIKSFFLEVEEYNNVAINLYESHGFKIIHKKKHFYSSGANALIMMRDV